MDRLRVHPRLDWQARVEKIGFTYHSNGERPDLIAPDAGWWDESVTWRFSAAEIDELEAAANELHQRCLDTVDFLSRHPDEMDAFCVPRPWRQAVVKSWQRQDPCLYGRFDLAFDPASGPPKMLEYNADTPTTLIEAAVAQWFWLEDVHPEADQFNSLHEQLVARWRETVGTGTLHLSCWAQSEEERQTVAYMGEAARQAGCGVVQVPIDAVGWHERRRCFVDQAGADIRKWFKLYPWEWLMAEQFGPNLLRAYLAGDISIIEPPWKMVLSNKAILPLLWRLFPGHDNLLAAAWSPDEVGPSRVRKRILAREGANIDLVRRGCSVLSTGGSYGKQPAIWQAEAALACRDGARSVLGLWMVGDQASGMIVRDDEAEIICAGSRIVPHFFVP